MAADDANRERAFEVSVPANTRYLRAVRVFCESVLEDRFDAETVGLLVLALDEACANIIKHCPEVATGRQITLQVSIGPKSAMFRLRDFCALADVARVKPRDLADLRPGGLGTHFIATIMDSVRFDPEPTMSGRVALVLEKRVPLREKVDPR
jgi:sigma-B regulation protein RsbU (phosphoserine phosphatase)